MRGKNGGERGDQGERVFRRKLLAGLLVLACLTPLGVILPRASGSGEAWGEWGPEYLQRVLGYLPQGLGKTMGVWRAPVSDYTFPGGGGALASQVVSYAASAAAGIFLIFLVAYLFTRIVKGHER